MRGQQGGDSFSKKIMGWKQVTNPYINATKYAEKKYVPPDNNYCSTKKVKYMFFAIFSSLCQCLFHFGDIVKCQFSRRHHAFRSLKKFITDPRFCFRRKCHMRAVSEASNLPNDSLLLHHDMPNKFKVWW